MAKIDITKIDGFEAMSAEDKIKALTEFEYDDNSSALEEANKKIKGLEGKGALYDKVSSELAALKKEKREKMSEDEKARLELEERDKRLKELEESIAKRDKVDKVLSTYSKYGMDRETAEKFVEEGDMEIITKMIDAHTQKELDKQKDGQSDPAAGHNGGGNKNFVKPTSTFDRSIKLDELDKLSMK